MDLVVRQGEGTTKSFSAANLLEVVDRGFTVTGGATGVVKKKKKGKARVLRVFACAV